MPLQCEKIPIACMTTENIELQALIHSMETTNPQIRQRQQIVPQCSEHLTSALDLP